MKIYTTDGTELMTVASISRSGSSILIEGKIMGSMPMKAVLRPEEARKGLKLVSFRLFWFLLTFLFRSSDKARAGAGKKHS